MQDTKKSSLIKPQFLVSYYYMKKEMEERFREYYGQADFWMDSGAYTAWKQGEKIELREYLKYIDRLSSLGILPLRYFMLDVIGDPWLTKKNLDFMLDAGYKPIPIFTRGEAYEMIDYYYSVSDLLAFGGIFNAQKADKQYIRYFMQKVGNRGRKIHWLGFTAHDFITYYKPFSCDSSTWSMMTRYGHLYLYRGKGQFVIVHREDFMERPSDFLMKLIREYEEDPFSLGRKESWRSTQRNETTTERLSYKAWMKYAMDIQRYTGTRYCLALNGAGNVDHFMEAFEFWRKKDDEGYRWPGA